jgi:hypothetical protein
MFRVSVNERSSRSNEVNLLTAANESFLIVCHKPRHLGSAADEDIFYSLTERVLGAIPRSPANQNPSHT